MLLRYDAERRHAFFFFFFRYGDRTRMNIQHERNMATHAHAAFCYYAFILRHY